METPANKDQNIEQRHEFNGKKGRVLGGAVIIIVGVLLLAYKAGADLPEWLFTWPMIIVAAGIFVGAKHDFRDWGWLFPVGVGVIFLLHESFEGYSWHNLWPIIIIIAGVTMILNAGNRRHRYGCRKHRNW
jgi:hypothetical protein